MFYVVSSARKLIFHPPVAPVVSFPEGAIVSDYGVNNKTPSIVVRNGTETPPTWQGVDRGTGVIIVNEVPEEVAEVALDMFNRGDGTIGALNDVIGFLVGRGCADQYTTSLGFVDTKLSPAGRMLDSYTGIVKRDDRDLIPCWREDGNFFVVHGTGGSAKLIQPGILVRTYRNSDGSPIDLDKIPEGRPEGA